MSETPSKSPDGPGGFQLSRRGFISAVGAIGALSLTGALASCAPEPAVVPTPTRTAKAGGPVRLWYVPSSPAEDSFFQVQFELFAKKNPDVMVTLQSFPAAQYANAMQLAFTGGQDAPDVFKQASGQGINLNSAYARGWVQPVTGFLTDEFKSRYPEALWDPASSPLYLDGEAWGIAANDPAVNGARLLYYNTDLLKASGFRSPPETWSEMREIAKAVTKDAAGSAYGMGIVGKNIASIQIMQNLAGPQAYRTDAEPPISLLSGKPAMAESSLVKMIKFFQSLNADGSLTPGWETWDPATALQQMAAGRLGMYIFPIYHVAELRKLNPDLNFGFAAPPVPDSGRKGSRGPADGAAPWWMMSSTAVSTEAAWRVMDFLGSVEFQKAQYEQLGEISIMPSVSDGSDASADTRKIVEIANDLVRTRPDPARRNPTAYAFYNDLVAEGPKPLPAATYLDAIIQNSDFQGAAATYDSSLARVIADLEVRHDLSAKEAFAFPDWNPLEDYAG